jgi:proteasome accessory factor C
VKSLQNVLRLHRLLKRSRYPVPFARVQEELECSPATVKRVIAYLRDQLGAPVERSREPPGYFYSDQAFELPGIWFSADEVQALLTLQQLLGSFQPGVLDEALSPLRARLDEILRAQGLRADQVGRIRLLRAAARSADHRHFSTVASACLQRQRLRLVYVGRARGTSSEREVSPQRLVHYRDHWYLDAWCHQANGLRSFALDRIEAAERLGLAAEDHADAALDAELASAYGIFSGVPSATARLRFTAEQARWVAGELWHPAQQSRWCEDGRYELDVPYHHDAELLLDILRFGPGVEVLGQPALRAAVARRLAAAAAQYAGDHTSAG